MLSLPHSLQKDVSTTPDVFISYLQAHSPDQIKNGDASKPASQDAVKKCFKDGWTGPFKDSGWKDGGLGSAAQPLPKGVTELKVPNGM